MSAQQDKLLKLFRRLASDKQETLIQFAEFLVERESEPDSSSRQPLAIPRPAEESVVGAMRRLTATYPMLDTSALFSQASSLMTQHIIQGRDAVDVIDELEQLFHDTYRTLLKD